MAEGLAQQAKFVLVARAGVSLPLPADHTSEDQEDVLFGRKRETDPGFLKP